MIEACTAASSYCLLGIPADLTHRILSLHLQLVELSLMLRKPNMLCQEMFTFPTRHLLLIHIDRMTRMLLECLPCFKSLLEQALKCNCTITFWELQQSDTWLCLSSRSPHWECTWMTVWWTHSYYICALHGYYN